MANTNHIRGRNCSFRLWNISGGCFQMTGDGNSFTLSYSGALLDTSAYGDDTITHFPDIKDYTVSYSGYYNAASPNNTTACTTACWLAEAVGASEGLTFQVAPAGSAAGGACTGYAGCVHIESLDMDFPSDGMCTYSFTLRPRSGSLTFKYGDW